MFIAAALFAALAGLLHVYIWYLESFAWTTAARKVFGTSEQEARATREMAFNQGYYNLFLAVMAFGGVLAGLLGNRAVGTTLILAGTGSMFAAAAVLFLTSPDKRAAAIRQGAFPLVAVVLTLFALI